MIAASTKKELFERCLKHFEAGEIEEADKLIRPLARNSIYGTILHDKICDLEERIVDVLIEREDKL